MRVMVTGSTGFLGRHFTAHLLDNTDWEIVAVHGMTYADDRESLPTDPRLTIIDWDLTVPLDIDVFGKVDIIYHLAASSHVDRSISDPVPFIMNNVQLTINVLEYARNVKVRSLINFSTDETVGCANPYQGHAENAPHRPSNPYAASKAAQEDIAYSYWRTYGVPLITTRCMNLISRGQNEEKFLPKTIKAIKEDRPVTVHATRVDGVHYDEDTHDICDSGLAWESGSRFWTPVETACEALLFLSQRIPYQHQSLIQDDPEVYHIVGHYMTNADLARKVGDLLSKEVKIEWFDAHSARPGHDPHYHIEDNKLKALGFKSSIDFDEYLTWIVEES